MSGNCETSTMSFLWICLSLFYAASFLKSSASSSISVLKPGVSLKCNETVGEVEAGKDVTLYCVISYSESLKNEDCMVRHCDWSNTAGIISCNTDQKYTCERDDQTYVSLTILGVNKNESYNVSIDTDCGPTTSSAINVRVKHDTPAAGLSEGSPEATGIVTPVVLGIFATFFVFGFLCFLFLTEKGRRIIRQSESKSHTHSPV